MNKHIAFILSNIKGANNAFRSSIKVPYSRSTLEFADLLYKSGYIARISVISNKIEITLRYHSNIPNVTDISFYSKPGRSLFIEYKNLLKYYSLNEFIILSTIYGYMTIADAHQLGLGGKLICKIN